MPRNRYPEVTVQKILDVSLALFLEKGFEQTTVLDIVAGLEGMTRGAFYHHFESKEEVLGAILDQSYNDEDLLECDEVRNAPNGLERLRVVMKRGLLRNTETEQSIAVTNLYVGLAKSPRFFVEKFRGDLTVAGIFAPIIAEGMEDGSIKQGNPKLLAELLLLLVNFWMFPGLYPSDSMEEMQEKAKMSLSILEMLGLPILDEEMGEMYKATLKIVSE